MTPGPLVAGSAVILTGDWLALARNAVLLAARNLRQNGLSASAHGQLAEAMRCALAADGRKTVAGQPEAAELISTREAAHRLKCSERQARRIAARVGRRVGRQWLIPADQLERMK